MNMTPSYPPLSNYKSITLPASDVSIICILNSQLSVNFEKKQYLLEKKTLDPRKNKKY